MPHIFSNNLILNETYKKGNSRAGCLVCPMAGEKQEYFRRVCYPNETQKYIDIIEQTNAREFPTEEDTYRFMNKGGWKVRNNGRDIKTIPIKYEDVSQTKLRLFSPHQDWKVWLKTVGSINYDGKTCSLIYKGSTYSFIVEEDGEILNVEFSETMVKESSTLVKYIKQSFHKVAYCICCKECQADCPYGYISFENGKIQISDKCKHCLNCHKPAGRCLLFKSLEQPKGNGIMENRAIDCYADHAPKIEWIQSFFELKDDFMSEHSLGSVMISMFKRFLRDAGLLENNKLTALAYRLDEIGIEKQEFWGVLLVNLSHTPGIGWYVKNIPYDTPIKKDYLIQLLQDSGAKERGAKSVSGAYRKILALPFGTDLGLGTVITEGRSFSICRGHWSTPDPRVILYSLYKFAENCGDYYQFSLTTLLDDTIERDGVSPTRIFGLDRETMVPILNGLSINYSEFISASFTLGLDTISLRPDKASEDVLSLF